jgi:hypothetical protein
MVPVFRSVSKLALLINPSLPLPLIIPAFTNALLAPAFIVAVTPAVPVTVTPASTVTTPAPFKTKSSQSIVTFVLEAQAAAFILIEKNTEKTTMKLWNKCINTLVEMENILDFLALTDIKDFLSTKD